MDNAAFIVALAVFAVVAFWYLENEFKSSDGASGLFAVRPAEQVRRVCGAQRYRTRESRTDPETVDAFSETVGSRSRYRRKDRAWDRAAALEDDNGI